MNSVTLFAVFVQQTDEPKMIFFGMEHAFTPRVTRNGSSPFIAAAHREKELRVVPTSTVARESNTISTNACSRECELIELKYRVIVCVDLASAKTTFTAGL